MSGTYDQILPSVFPYCTMLDDKNVDFFVRILSSRTPEFPNGSSFVVTSVGNLGLRKFWLSESSYNRIKRYFPNVPTKDAEVAS